MIVRWRLKKTLEKQHFLLHYNQVRASRMNQQLPINVLRRGPIVHDTIKFIQHKNQQEYLIGY